jgi:hypothetical protein
MLLNENQDQAEQILHPPTLFVYSPDMSQLFRQTEFRVSQFPDKEDRDGSWNVGLLAIQPPDMAANPKICYWSMKL